MAKGRKDDKFELFCLAYSVPGTTAVAASDAAGYPRGKNAKTYAANARKRANHPDTKKRVAEIRASAVEKVKATILESFDSILEKLSIVIGRMPRHQPEYNEWLAAVKEYGKLRDMYPKELPMNAGLFAGKNVTFNVVYARESDTDKLIDATRDPADPVAVSLSSPV